MIVDPDFLDHWKTLVLVDELDGDPAAPLYVLRLWAHCQNRRCTSFHNLSEVALKALCRYPGHANKLMAALTTSGFIRVSDGGEIIVHEWGDYNAKLIANWENGAKGGRPKKPTNNPKETQPKPNDNPTETQPPETETHAKPIREDRSREEEISHTPSSGDDDRGRKRVSEKEKPRTYSEEFERFWSVYWNRSGKAKAYEAFRPAIARIANDRAIPTATDPQSALSWLVYRTKLYRSQLDDATTKLHASTYLNQDRFNDELVDRRDASQMGYDTVKRKRG